METQQSLQATGEGELVSTREREREKVHTQGYFCWCVYTKEHIEHIYTVYACVTSVQKQSLHCLEQEDDLLTSRQSPSTGWKTLQLQF